MCGIIRQKRFGKCWCDMEKWIIVWDDINTGVIRLRNVYDDGTLDLSKHKRAYLNLFQTKLQAHMIALRLAEKFGVTYDISWSGIHGTLLELNR